MDKHGYTKKDFLAVAAMHIEGISTGFLSTLGTGSLQILYEAIACSPYSLLVVERENDRVIGFVAFATDVKRMYRWIVVHYFFRLFVVVVPELLSLSAIKKAGETLLYPFIRKNTDGAASAADSGGKETGTMNAELLSIAVLSGQRRKKIGSRLIVMLEQYLRKNNIGEYKVVTAADDEHSNAFYRRNDFVFCYNFLHHDILMNKYTRKVQ